MRVAVCLAWVLDATLPLTVDRATGTVEQAEPEPVWVVNPADRAALELAMRLGGETVAVTLGPEAARGALTYALARGAEGAVHVLDPGEARRMPAEVAGALAEAIRALAVDLVLCGERTLQAGTGEVGPRLAEALGWPQVTGAVAVEVAGRVLRAERRLAAGSRQMLETSFPAVVSVTAGASEPRYVSVLARARAAGLPVEVLPARVGEGGFLKLLRQAPARPRPKRVPLPEKGLSAAERMRVLLGGGTAPRADLAAATGQGDRRPLEGDPEELADRVVRFLAGEGIL